MAEDLRDVVAVAIANTVCDHVDVGAACSRCRANAAVAAMTEDPGTLPARMAEAIDETWTSEEDFDADKAARAALSVRDELVAHLSARAAAAEARVVHAEEGAQLSSERLSDVRKELVEARDAIELEKVRADAAERKCEMAEQAAKRWHDEYGRIESKAARSQAQLTEIEEAVFAHFTSGAPAGQALHAVRDVFVRTDEGRPLAESESHKDASTAGPVL